MKRFFSILLTGSDFDGIETTPIDMEDVSKYPNLFAELINRGCEQAFLVI